MSNWIFVDVEARGGSPVNGIMTELGRSPSQAASLFTVCYLKENQIQAIRMCHSLESNLPPIKKWPNRFVHGWGCWRH